MPRLICLGHAVKRKAEKGSRSRPAPEPQRVYSILESVPLRLAFHVPIWRALAEHATRQLVIDQEHPEEAMPAEVLPLDRLANGALERIERALRDRLTKTRQDIDTGVQRGVLAKDLDGAFEREKEWLAIRGLLASALPRTKKAKKGRAILLINA
jgi:hypothetical protein